MVLRRFPGHSYVLAVRTRLRTFSRATSVTSPSGPAKELSRTSVFTPLTCASAGKDTEHAYDAITHRVERVYEGFPRELFEHRDVQRLLILLWLS